MAYTIPDIPPAELTQGLTAKWTANPSQFPTSEGWRLSYRFAGPTPKTFAAAASAGRHLVTVSATNSAALTEGEYSWQSYAASAAIGETYAVESGALTVARDYRLLGEGYDARSTAKQILDALDATLLGTATSAQQQMSVDGRALSRYGISELLKLRDRYATIFASETNRARIAAGQASTRNIRARFTAA